MNLTGIWENINGKDNDIVNIYHIGTDLFIHGFNYHSNPTFENFGFAKEVEGYKGEEFKVTWTDTEPSLGSEKNKVHCTEIKIKSKTELEQIHDNLLTNSTQASTTYGNWKRK